MSGVHTRSIILIGIAAVGIVLFSFANLPAGLRGGGGLDPGATPTPGGGLERNLVQLPKPSSAEAFGGLARPTLAPTSSHAGQPEPSDAVPGEATVAIEDPYNG